MKEQINEEVVSIATFCEDIEAGNAIYLKDGGMAVTAHLVEEVAKHSALFPLKHLFSIVDGRLSTSISDIQSIFGVYCGRSVFTKRLKRKPTYFSRWMNFDNVIWCF